MQRVVDHFCAQVKGKRVHSEIAYTQVFIQRGSTITGKIQVHPPSVLIAKDDPPGIAVFIQGIEAPLQRIGDAPAQPDAIRGHHEIQIPGFPSQQRGA